MTLLRVKVKDRTAFCPLCQKEFHAITNAAPPGVIINPDCKHYRDKVIQRDSIVLEFADNRDLPPIKFDIRAPGVKAEPIQWFAEEAKRFLWPDESITINKMENGKLLIQARRDDVEITIGIAEMLYIPESALSDFDSIRVVLSRLLNIVYNTRVLDCGHLPERSGEVTINYGRKVGFRQYPTMKYRVKEDGSQVCIPCYDKRVVDCGHHPSSHAAITSGTAHTQDGREICTECADREQREELLWRNSVVQYFTSNEARNLMEITTWTGGRLMDVYHYYHSPRAAFGHGLYYLQATDVWGNHWRGTSPGKSMYARLHRMKSKSEQARWFAHDCFNCGFLGQLHLNDRIYHVSGYKGADYDLFFCVNHLNRDTSQLITCPVVVVRFGNDPDDTRTSPVNEITIKKFYMPYHELNPRRIAVMRAIEAGLVSREFIYGPKKK